MTYTFFTYNTHLFGRTGMIEKRPTSLVYQDERRADEICSRINKQAGVDSGPHFVGLKEVWDDELGKGIELGVREAYPYRISSPSARGIDEILECLQEKWPRISKILKPRTEGLVEFFARGHYSVEVSFWQGIIRYCLNEDRMIWLLEHLLGLPKFLGAGLLFFSKYPIVSWEFIPYAAKADLERLIIKGVLKVELQTPDGSTFTVALTHLQEGASAHAQKARARQVDQLASLKPDVAMGDFNFIAREYEPAQKRLGLTDSFRLLHPDPISEPGYTYEHNNPKNPYSSRLGVRSAPGQGPQRIDFIFTRNFTPIACDVPAEEFISDDGNYFLSDHHPVRATLGSEGI